MLISHRQADLIDKIKKQPGKEVKVTFEFAEGNRGYDVNFRGGTLENLSEDLNGNVLNIMKKMEDFVHAMPGYIYNGHVGIVPNSTIGVIVVLCLNYVKTIPGYKSHQIIHNNAYTEYFLRVMVQQ